MSYLIGCKLPTNNKNKCDAITTVTASVKLDPITRPNQHTIILMGIIRKNKRILFCLKNYAQAPQL